ncbi:MAG: hypothetical protein JWO33_485 [Caulobacteraceae bacterium]|nr:hypothetical protein [Caulobacteraceae bacterium]
MREFAYSRVRAAPRRLSTRKKLGFSRVGLTGAVLALTFGVVAGLAAQDGGVLFGSGLVLALIFLLLWQENEPPLLLLPALFQWSAVSTKPLMSLFMKTSINALSEYDNDIVPGAVLGLCAVAALTIGLRLGAGIPRLDWNAALKNEARHVTYKSLVSVALAAILLGHLFFYLTRYAGPLVQLFIALSIVRFVGLFALAYCCFVTRRGYGYLALASLVEIFIGITGFFSDFKAPIFVIGLAAIAAGHRPKFRDVAMVTLLASALLLLGSFWSAVKLDYRQYLSGGTMEQTITVPLGDRLAYLGDQVKNADGVLMADGFDQLLRRQSYIHFLGSTMKFVPERLPHEHGARLSTTLLNIVKPRFLFPDKPATEFDSVVTQKYTGLPIQVREGTSISIGYVGELYIDFGKVGAVIGCLLLGLAFGLAYQYLRNHGKGSLLLTYGIRATAILVLMPFETALIKYVGGAALAFVAAYLLQKFVAPWLSSKLRWRTVAAATGPQP